ncbi:integrator complex subunit 6-like [Limulus polyphemus]|uniref:Integrator complex subunit 6-like n=1 Tax=Limulus polyphemus TaxID=6850 RepID=A0ABM1S3Y6_LIMPO|nr:integrator complex subunit 6-like [Limulus polyphemus]
MTIILFLVDTSASMNQRTYLGARPTLLDVAKDAVERFIKIRQRDSASRGDRYMLLTFEEPPVHVKAGWKENHATFMNELKNLNAIGVTTMGPALRNAFDLLNVNRMQTGIDTYGQGRCPFYLEPSIIVVITDGGKLSSSDSQLNLPMSSMPGSELTKEPFRWDQRLFALVLRLAGTPYMERDSGSVVPPDSSPIDAMCEVTGGRSYAVTSHRVLMQCLESLVQKIQSGVVINFEKIGPDPPPVINEVYSETTEDKQINETPNHKVPAAGQNGLGQQTPHSITSTAWQSSHKLIYVQRSAQKGYSVGHWPIPESFWPDLNSPALPPRTAHPVFKFTCTNSEPMVIDNLPFDKYELEPSPLTQYILSRKQPTVAWQVYVSGSHKSSELGHSFGYLKASTTLTCVNLFVLPYNYPTLLPLLDEFFKVHRCKAPKEWKQNFESYLKNMPLYYAAPLKRALQRMGAPSLVPENMENCLSYSILNYLKRLKNQAKSEYEKILLMVGSNKQASTESIRINLGVHRPSLHTQKLSDLCLTSNPCLADRFSSLISELNDFSGFNLAVKDKEMKTESYRNPFDISRISLLDQITRMRGNFLQTTLSRLRLQDEDQLHTLPVGQMGNYQEYLKRMPTPLREIESTPVRQHMFGNPFKIEKRMMVDEADIDLVGGGSPQARGIKRLTDGLLGAPKPKRKPGPLPKDFPVRRPKSPSPLQSEDCFVSPVTDIHEKKASDQKQESKQALVDEEVDVSQESPTSVRNYVTNHIDVMSIQEDEEIPVTQRNGAVHNYYYARTAEKNSVLRAKLFKEVRKPGRDFSGVFSHLNNFNVGMPTKLFMVREVIHEAGRFKRKSLIKLLEDFEKTLLASHNSSSPFSRNSSFIPQLSDTR